MPDAPLRIVMMGTGGFAVPTFRALCESGHNVVALITRQSKPGRGRKQPPPSPMREEAERLGLPIHDPASINSPEAHELLDALGADLFVVCDYGQILASDTLSISQLGGINLHGSLLPKYRGAAPVNWAIYHGEKETGVTVIRMTPKLDAGPAIAQATIEIGSEETAVDVEHRLAAIGAPLVLDAIEHLADESITEIPQDRDKVTKAPRLKKSDGEVNWTLTARQIKDQWRAMQPWPGMFTFWQREPGKEPLRMILNEVNVVTLGDDRKPGEIVREGDRLLVATGEGAIEIVRLQPAGKQPLTTAEFLRGYDMQTGDELEGGN